MKKQYIRLLVVFFSVVILPNYLKATDQYLASGQSQEETTELVTALKRLQKETGIHLIYESEIVKGLEVDPMILNSTDDPTVILEELLNSVGLTYKTISKGTYAVVRPKKAIRQLTISGVITSGEDQSTLPGVNVLLQGTSTGVITDINGQYSITVPSSESVLIFSFIGFKTFQKKVGNQSILDVVMQPDIQQLSEVVITAIGLESDKRDLGYSIQNVDSEDLVNSRETNISSALSAKAAGVQVITSSGSPGAAAAVRIRGSRSARNNEPLYVIDGVPVSNNVTGNGIIGVDVSNRAIDINPNDVEKVTILKGPAATVLYGSRAANGAIMISTKRGQVGTPTITYSSAFGVNQVNKLPPMQSQYSQGSPSQGVWVYRGPETGESLSWGPSIDSLEFDGDTSYPYDQNGRLVALGQGNGVPARAYDVHDAFWVMGRTIDNNISVDGGTEAVRYYFSIGHLNQTGVVPNADFERTSVKSNIDAHLTPKLQAGISATYVHSGGNRAQRGSNLSGVTTGVFRNPPTFDIGNGKKGTDAVNFSEAYIFSNGDQRSYRGNGLYDNPFWSINRNPSSDEVDRVMGNISLKYDFWDWLSASYKIGLDQFTDRRNQAWDINSASEPQGRVIQSAIYSETLNSDFLILVNKQFQDIGIDATIGHNYFYTSRLSRSSEGNIMSVQGFYNIGNTQEVMSSETYGNRVKLFGAFADVRLNFREFLFLGLSARNDWSSTLPKENNSFFFPSASLGIEFTEPLGLSDNKYFPYGKIRVSYGQVGSSAGAFSTGAYYSNASIDGDGLLGANEFPAFGINAFERSGLLGNNELIHELTTTLEIGGDFQFLESRVGLDVTYYKAFTDNQIFTAPISAASGYTSITINAGEIQNKGIELVLNTSPIVKSKLNWDLDLTFTKNESLVKSVPDDVESIELAAFTAIASVNIPGHPFGVFRGTRYRRDDQGRLIIGSDGWPLLADTQGVIGDPNPDWFAGIKNSLSVFGVEFSMLWDVKKGGDVWNGTKAVMDYLGTSKESGDDRDVTGYVYDGVTVEGDVNTVPVDFANPSTGLSGIKWRKAGTLLGVAEDNIEDASWIRLREITIGYNFPKNLLKSAGMFNSARISLYGRNLLLITEYKGVDPETNLRGPSNAQGWDYFNLPGARSYGLTLNVVLK